MTQVVASTITLENLFAELASVCEEALREFEAEIGPTNPAARKRWKLDPRDAIFDPIVRGKFIGLQSNGCEIIKRRGWDRSSRQGHHDLVTVLRIALGHFHRSASIAARDRQPHPDFVEYLAAYCRDPLASASNYGESWPPLRDQIASVLLAPTFTCVGGCVWWPEIARPRPGVDYPA